MISHKTAILSVAAGSASVIIFFIIALMTGNVGRTFSILLTAGLVTLSIISFVNGITDWKEVRFQFKAPLLGMGTLCLLLAITLAVTQL
ncbi:MAG: hypothetical protein ACQEXQ_19175 [Bacillota bacterium]